MAIEKLTAALGAPTLATVTPAAPAAARSTRSPENFADALGRLVRNAEETGAAANKAVTQMMDKSIDVHDAMIALQRADMSLQFTVQVRNKLVHAYQEIMRMPL